MRRIAFGFVWLAALLLIGTLGFIVIESSNWLDAFYMTLITISTVGFREVIPLSDAGKVWTMILIVSGIGIIFYTASVTIEFMIEGHFGGLLEKRRLKKMREQLKNHSIICGYGRVGKQVAQEMARRKHPFIIIDIDENRLADAKKKGYLILVGDATKEEVLLEAGLDRASSLVAALDSDSQNVFIVLAVKQINPQLLIVARANDEEAEALLAKAGASHVVSPTIIGGRRIASVVLKPAVADFLDKLFPGESSDFELDEILITSSSTLKGKTLRELDLGKKHGLFILGIKKASEKDFLMPQPETLLEEGDRIIIIGKTNQPESFNTD